jgi:hypothetical protein
MNEDSFVQKTIKMKRIILPALIALFNIVELKAQEKKEQTGM